MLAIANVDEHGRSIERCRALPDRSLSAACRGPALLEGRGLSGRWWSWLDLRRRGRCSLNYARRGASTGRKEHKDRVCREPQAADVAHGGAS